MQQKRSLLFLVSSILFLQVPVLAQASDLTLERDLQNNLRQSRVLLRMMETALVSGESYSTNLTQLKALGESISTGHQALLERFRTRETQVNALGANAASRHAAMQERYEQAIAQYLSSLDDLSDTQVALDEILQLKGILEGLLPKKKRSIHGTVPYRHLNLPAQTPKTAPAMIPAYKGGDKTVADADLAASPEAPISLAIAQLAESLNWNPVEMYEWVKNNITTEWYWGCMKGSEETFRQKSGNDADQAALLVAIFRSAGFPARYVRGVIEFFPDIEAAKMQTGLDDPLEMARFLQKAGIPYETVIAGGRVNNFRIEHVWVEAEIPYDNYRGAMIDEYGKTWLALDTSIKAAGYTVSVLEDALETMDLSGIRESYLTDLKSETLLEYLTNDINNRLDQSSPSTTYEDLLLTRTINPEHMKIIPTGLQFKEVAITGEYRSLPADLLHKARFKAAKVDGTLLFDQTLPVYKLSNRSVAVTFEPETIEDQEIMHAYGGLDNTPSYLIHLRPLLTVDGNREILGQEGLSAGADFDLMVELLAPGASERIENILITGYPAIIGLSAQQAVMPETIPLEDKNAERLLFEQAMSYIDQGNKAEDELASLFQMSIARPLPTLITLGGVLDVIYLLDSPHGYEWQGVYLDANQRVVEPAGGVSFINSSDPKSLFMQLSSIQGSILENRIFENGFGVESISTAKLLALANEGGISLVSLASTNINAALPALNLPESIAEDITNGVNQGYVVTIPETEMFHEDWSGFGYIKENPATGESGWMLSGEIAGGMTALNPDRWPDDYADILANPMVLSQGDPLSAVEIKVIKGLDILAGTAGQQLKTPFQIIAIDREGKRVKGVDVFFEVKAGGGKVRNVKLTTGTWQTEVMATTGFDGIAEVDLLFDQSTNINPTTAKRQVDDAVQKVDETVFEVTSSSGLQTAAPISVYAFPDDPHHLLVEGGNATDSILSWGATLVAYVEDQYGNPINKQDVNFVMGNAQLKSVCSSSNNDNRPGLLVSGSDPCMSTIPVYGECGDNTVSDVTGLHIGAVAHVILGGLPDANYPITVKSGTLADEIVNVSSNPVGVCDAEDEPYNALALKVIHASDSLGNIINGGEIGTTIPLYARMYFVREKGTTIQKDFPCSPSGTDTCPVNIGTGEYYTDTNSVTASVKFDGYEAVHEGEGLFRIDYPLSATAMKHEVGVKGEATEKIKITVDICDQNNTCKLIDFNMPSPIVEHATEVYAVDISIPQEKHIIPVDENGYVTYEYPIEYTIAPPEYTAGTAYFVMSKQTSPGVFEKVSYLNSNTSGKDHVTLLRGFRFDHDTPYKAHVVLNEASDYMEVNSKEMGLIPITIELDADLNGDGNFTEDDPAEHVGAGLIVPLNINDNDNDGIPDNIDGFDSDGIANDDDEIKDVNGVIVPDDDLAEIRLTGLPATLTEGSVVLEAIQGAEKVRVWTTKDKGKDNILIDFAATGLAQKQWALGPNNDLADLSELTRSLYVEGIKESVASGDTAILVTKYISPEGVEVEMDRLVVTVFMIDIVPDYNRDGKIDVLDRGKVTALEPWRIWINDDNDAGADAEGIGGSADDLPGQNRDNDDTQVNGIRDLVDFFPLYLNLRKALQLWPYSEGYKYVLKDGNALTAEDVKLAMFEGMGGSQVLTADKAYDYLENLALSNKLSAKDVHAIDAAGIELSAAFLDKISSSDKNGIILVEAWYVTASQLVLEISQNGKTVHSVSLPLEIVPVEDMFGHKNLRAVAGANDGDANRYTDVDQTSNKLVVGNNQEIGKQPYCMQGVNKSLVWMHGYNIDPEAARGTFAEVFKRFFHAGLNGRFYGVSWFGNPRGHFANPTAAFSPHYHQAVVNAFATAGDFAAFVNTIPGPVSIAAHSLGNLVAGEGIQQGLTVANYFAVDAAVALEAYGDIPRNADGEVSLNPDMVNVEDWPDYIAAGQSRLLASEWHRLFSDEPMTTTPVYPPLTPPTDNRALLTWRGRLANVPGLNVYNFYSSTEDVLRTYPGDDLLWDGAGANLGMFSWVKQEKFKGRRDRIGNIPQVGMDVGGASSNYCGWSFNSDWNHWFGWGGRLTPQEAAVTISNDDLKIKPFFALDKWHLFTDLSSILEPNLNTIVGEVEVATPSNFVMKNVRDTDLDGYYTYNDAAHDKVLVRDWLLAEAFPATTLSMGANNNSLLRIDGQNVDMSGDSSKGDDKCCKTSEDSWPDDRKGEWKHSDYKDISYQHTFEFYKKIKVMTGN